MDMDQALHEAIRDYDITTVSALIEQGADVNAVLGTWSALLYAADEGASNIVICLLEHGADVNAGSSLGWTALMSAVSLRRNEIMRILLDHGANVNIHDAFGRTALMYAAEWCNVEGVRLLLEHGANLHATDNNGLTALQLSQNSSDNPATDKPELQQQREAVSALLKQAGAKA